jgi:hypothetical protein
MGGLAIGFEYVGDLLRGSFCRYLRKNGVQLQVTAMKRAQRSFIAAMLMFELDQKFGHGFRAANAFVALALRGGLLQRGFPRSQLR